MNDRQSWWTAAARGFMQLSRLATSYGSLPILFHGSRKTDMTSRSAGAMRRYVEMLAGGSARLACCAHDNGV